MAQRRILVIDDHPLFRTALCKIVQTRFQDSSIVQCSSPDAVQRASAKQERPHLVILDLNITNVHGFNGLLLVRSRCPNSPILVLSDDPDPMLARRSLTLGAKGYVSKAHEEFAIRAAISAVIKGQTWLPENIDASGDDAADVCDVARRIDSLSPRQLGIFALIRAGLLNKQICYDLGITETTVKAHVTVILEKLKAMNRTEAVIIAHAIDGPLLRGFGKEMMQATDPGPSPSTQIH